MTARFKLWSGTADKGRGVFHCPGCRSDHTIRMPEPHQWNGDAERPTLTPSVILSWTGKIADGSPRRVCHSYVRDGSIEFLADCTHSLAGQTVPLPAYPVRP